MKSARNGRPSAENSETQSRAKILAHGWGGHSEGRRSAHGLGAASRGLGYFVARVGAGALPKAEGGAEARSGAGARRTCGRRGWWI